MGRTGEKRGAMMAQPSRHEMFAMIAESMDRIIARCNAPERGQTTLEDLRNQISRIASAVKALTENRP